MFDWFFWTICVYEFEKASFLKSALADYNIENAPIYFFDGTESSFLNIREIKIKHFKELQKLIPNNAAIENALRSLGPRVIPSASDSSNDFIVNLGGLSSPHPLWWQLDKTI